MNTLDSSCAQLFSLPQLHCTSTGISFDSNFEGGNATLLKIVPATIPSVHFAATPKGSPEAFWFHFKLKFSDTPSFKEVRCVLHFYETLMGNLFGADVYGFHPVYKTTLSSQWTRVTKVKESISPSGVKSVEWLIPAQKGDIEIALSYPYLINEANQLLQDTSPFYKSEIIGLTASGHPLNRIYNTVNMAQDSGSQKPGFYCLARQHAAEAPGSWVLDGFLREMAIHGDAAPLIWSIPFTDFDGCINGNPGKDSFPWDYNRAWGSRLFPQEMKTETGSHPMRHEIKSIQLDMQRWKEQCRPCLVLDFHAPTACDDSGIFLFLRDLTPDGKPDAAHTPWVETVEKELSPHLKSSKFVRSGRYLSRWNTARAGDFVTKALKLPMITVEVPYAANGSFIYQKEDYHLAGKQIASALLQKM